MVRLVRRGSNDRVYRVLGNGRLAVVENPAEATKIAGKDWRDKVESLSSSQFEALKRPAPLNLTPEQLRQLVQGRRSASTGFKTTLANLGAEKQRGLANFRTRFAELQRQFARERDAGMDRLGGRGLASQPKFAGNFLKDMRNEEASQAGQLELNKSQLLSQIGLDEQRARAERDARLADLDALEAAFRTDTKRIMGGAR